MGKRNLNRMIGILLGIVLTAGCAGQPLKVEPIDKTKNPSALTEELGQALSAARQDQVNLLSPAWFGRAQSSYEKARSGMEKGSQLNAILENIATGEAQLGQARIYADRSRKTLADVIESRDAAMAARADRYKEEFADLEEGFLKLTRAVENDDSGYIQTRRKEINSAYRALELRAIKDTALGDVRRLLAQGRDRKMDEIAPKSYLIAQSKLMDAEAAINRDRYAKDEINRAVDEARFYAQRMNNIAGASVQFQGMTPEAIALKFESCLAQTLTRLKAPDSRNLSFDAQEGVVRDAIAALQRNQSSSFSLAEARGIEIDKLKKRVAELEGRTFRERIDKERLAEEKRFNELYTQVQSLFSGDQAEVYKKGQELVIRLKAIRFPVGQAVILPDNYPLLTTVQKAIGTFGNPDVVIEGHTDSTGSTAKNEALSQQRASSVRQYLIYNGSLPADKITAVGYGSTRPLASNETAEGRAINRRIDVIIKPVHR